MAFCVSQMVSSLMIALTETSPSAARQIKNFSWFVFILCFLSLVGIEPGHFNDPSFFATPVIERSLSLLVVIIIHRLYCLYRNIISYVHLNSSVRTSCHYVVARSGTLCGCIFFFFLFRGGSCRFGSVRGNLVFILG